MAINVREARSIIRQAKRRVPAGESISSLNLTAMMDMMTILLIFLIQDMAITTSPLSVSVTLPPSTTRAPEPEAAKTVTIAKSAILVEGMPVVRVQNGDVDASEKSQGQFGNEIGKLRVVLSEHHEALYRLSEGEEPTHELTILADKDIPYRLLYSVMFTAGRASAKSQPSGPGFTKYRLIVLREGQWSSAQPDVLVVGAGVIGASVAWHLAARGASVLVIDRGAAPGAGSTARATGGFRAQFGSEVNVRLSLLSREKLLRFRDEVGADPGYLQAGYLFLAVELDPLRAALAVQRRAGFNGAREVDAAEAARLAPGISLEGVAGGTFCPSDGFLRPMEILGGYLAAARRLGARVEYGVECLAMRREGERIVEVTTSRGALAAGAVVDAAGPWAADVAGQAGVELPVTPARRQVLPTVGAGRLRADHPMSIWVEDGFHFRERDGRALLLMPDAEDWMARVEACARARVPALAGVAVDRAAAWSGLYEMSPDGHAIVGRAPGCPDLVLANGSSGHGVMHAPALGQLVAEIVLDGGARALDVAPLRPTRFAEGDPVRGMGLL